MKILKTDNKGRVTLGRDWANREIDVRIYEESAHIRPAPPQQVPISIASVVEESYEKYSSPYPYLRVLANLLGIDAFRILLEGGIGRNGVRVLRDKNFSTTYIDPETHEQVDNVDFTPFTDKQKAIVDTWWEIIPDGAKI